MDGQSKSLTLHFLFSHPVFLFFLTSKYTQEELEGEPVVDPVLVKAKPRSHRVCVGSELSSRGKCCLRPQVLCGWSHGF